MLESDNSRRSLRRRLPRRSTDPKRGKPAPPRPLRMRENSSGIVPSPSAEENPHFNLRYVLSNPLARPGAREARTQTTGPKGGKFQGKHRSGVRSRADVSPIIPTSDSASKTAKTSKLAPLRPLANSPRALVHAPRTSKLVGLRSAALVSDRPRPIQPTRLPATSSNQVRSRHPRRSRRPPSPLLYVVRLLILGVGIGAIVGTILSIWNPALREPPATADNTGGGLEVMSHIHSSPSPGVGTPLLGTIPLNQEMSPLGRKMQTLAAEYPGLTLGVYLVDLDNGNYLNLNGTSAFSAASTIKVPILVAFLQDVDAGKIRLDEMLTMEQKHVGGGSGEMQYQPVGTQYTALETATNMIVISDNTATNMLIDRLGGVAALNQRFRSWNLMDSTIRNLLPDLGGTNMTSPRDLSDLLIRVSQGELLSLRSRDRLLEIMQKTVTDTLLPRGLDPGAVIAHKTGTIDTIVGDTGLIDMPTGKRYVITVLVLRSADDYRAQELIRQISRTAYQYLLAPQATPSATDSLLPQGSAATTTAPQSTTPDPTPIQFPLMGSGQ